MPRYYDLTIALPNAAANAPPVRHWTTNPKPNVYDAGALNVEFDILVSPYATPTGAQGITVYGVSLNDLLQAQQFAGTAPGNGMILTLKAGMTAGLPLAKPAQAGIIVQGVITQSFGNWIGTEMTLDFVIAPSIFAPQNPGNLVINWQPNTPLSQALAQTLAVAYPNVKQNIQISSQLTLTQSEAQVGAYPTLEALSTAILNATQGTLSNDYPGVSIVYQGGQLYVFDGTVASTKTSAIDFNDLIGQPTWIDVNLMQFKTVMRSDLQVNSSVTMPQFLNKNGTKATIPGLPGFVTTSGQSSPNGLKYQSSFKGNFTITQVRHVGNLRAPDGESWVSTFNCIPN